MFSSLRALTDIYNWKPEAQRRGFKYLVFAFPVMFIMVVMALMLSLLTFAKAPKAIDTYAAITNSTRAQFFAQQTLQLWMTGTPSSEKVLTERSSAARSISLGEVPMEVYTIDPTDVQRFVGADATEWQFTFAVTLMTPSSGTKQINRYQVTILERKEAFQLLLWPTLVNAPSSPFKAASKFNVGIESSSPIGQSVQRFVSAYYTSDTKEGSLDRLTSSEFRGGPISNSPYTKAELVELKAEEGSTEFRNENPGATVNVLATVKASASTKTWSIMHLPLKMSFSTNKVWVADGFVSPVNWGQIEGK